METPALRQTDAARTELLAMMSRITEYRPIASVMWVTAGTSGRLLPDGREEILDLGPHWGVGFYSPHKVPPEEIVEIDGIPFVFGQGQTSMRLDGAILDFIGGQFVVKESERSGI